ncbi:peroxisomal biogenesis factor 11 [Nadsonia fulvescens var. elongata DSM 6958]|uniref:Peroxisomal biogenesis factor 11 n=1 Tax=Nadsonia fulvescens var. elongata DSM 6958 TaxID=857566 RepID=A0A1E3PCJ6_9ASCO|nr:peroxisomal biogenesis factor 11 [Nadsonia fulvescens var. elongata DSM 6958]
MSAIIASHPTIGHVVRYLESTTGRDKLLRTVQYWSKFLAFVLYRKGFTAPTVAFWKTLQTQLGLSRKLFRVGKFVNHAKQAATAYNQQTTDPLLRASTVARQLGYTFYLIFDTLNWIHSSGVYRLNQGKTIGKIASRFWLMGLVSSVVNSLRKLQIAQLQAALLREESEKDLASLKRVQAESQVARKQLAWDLLDMTNPMTSLGLLHFDDGVVGLAGFITALWGVQAAWEKTK